MVGGISIGPTRKVYRSRPNGEIEQVHIVGTLGLVVKDELEGSTFMLSNWHVLFADNVGGPGDVIIQPSPVDTSERNRVGTNIRGRRNSKVDCAIARNYHDRDASINEIADDPGQEYIFTDPGEPPVDFVWKRGRTIKKTAGFISATDASVIIDGDRFIDQILIISDRNSRFADKGDSGSVILMNQTLSTKLLIVGLLFGSEEDGEWAVANKILTVFRQLGVRPVN